MPAPLERSAVRFFLQKSGCCTGDDVTGADPWNVNGDGLTAADPWNDRQYVFFLKKVDVVLVMALHVETPLERSAVRICLQKSGSCTGEGVTGAAPLEL